MYISYLLLALSSMLATAGAFATPRQLQKRVIGALLQLHPVGATNSGVDARQLVQCPSNYHQCPGTDGCCRNDEYCGVFGGEIGCCPNGEHCSSTGSCPRPDDISCPTGGCCRAGESCAADGTCNFGGSGNGNGGTTTTHTVPRTTRTTIEQPPPTLETTATFSAVGTGGPSGLGDNTTPVQVTVTVPATSSTAVVTGGGLSSSSSAVINVPSAKTIMLVGMMANFIFFLAL
ncbi:hypothetical protein AMATHDRAFT_1273 [Amanita thiersii Skay4041]|uniref:Carbohydrate-binding module family 18 protein n=1 Tax=Amanita thiersii Skay4041 TaxID=703135 RepID=A0A2A9NYP3_9AGAR|nr:hypothetical protein AMATHDRAFT_1273 [Amanita thiersii Skay4041]